MEKLNKNNILHDGSNLEHAFNSPNGAHGFQDENGIYHWLDRDGMHDGNMPSFETPSLNSDMKEILRNSNHLAFGNEENSALNSHEYYSENNMVDLNDNVPDSHIIEGPNDNSIEENNHVQTNEEIVSHTLDNSDNVSFRGYYYTGPNGERLYKAGDGHTYDINNNKVD